MITHIFKQDAQDKQNMTIPKGTRIYIIKELFNPHTRNPEHIISIDNGTGLKDTYPKTLIDKKNFMIGLGIINLKEEEDKKNNIHAIGEEKK